MVIRSCNQILIVIRILNILENRKIEYVVRPILHFINLVKQHESFGWGDKQWKRRAAKWLRNIMQTIQKMYNWQLTESFII